MKNEKVIITREFTGYPIVDSLENLEFGRIYTTYNHDLFKPLSGNRGVDTGVVSDRALFYMGKISDGTFYHNVEHVKLNRRGQMIDGHNKDEALRRTKKPVNFMIYPQDEFNEGTVSDILNAVAEYNSINSGWQPTENYVSALMWKEPCAVAIDKLKTEVDNKFGLPITMFTPARIIALAIEDPKGLDGKKRTRKEYCDKKTADIINSPDFRTQIEFICNVLLLVKSQNPNIREWFVIRKLMPFIWYDKRNLRVVYHNLVKYGFKKLINTNMPGIKARVEDIIDKHITKGTVLHTWDKRLV